MKQRYKRLIENVIEFINYSRDFMLNNQEDQQFIQKQEVKIIEVSSIELAKGYLIQKVQGKEVEYFCIEQNQSILDREQERLGE